MAGNKTQDKIILETGTNELEIITFFLRTFDKGKGQYTETYYGINAAKVSELIAMPTGVTKVANSPECVRGVFLLRSRTIPLIDVCAWFQHEADLSPEAKQKWTVIISELNGRHFGFISHGVDKVYRTSWESILPPHELIAASRSLTGMVIIENRLIQMVDFENITFAIDPKVTMTAGPDPGTEGVPAANADKFVVIADDSTVIRESLRKALRAASFKVIEFTDGQSCWEYMQEVKTKGKVADTVLAVVSDIEMPRMDGHRLCKYIKDDPAFNRIPVILFSSMINDALRRKGETVGADAQVTKPEFALLIKNVLDLTRPV